MVLAMYLVIPGLMGSTLDRIDSTNPVPVWGRTTTDIGLSAALGNLDQLQLDPSGLPLFPISSTGYMDYYDAVSAEFGGLTLDYDWRLTPQEAALQIIDLVPDEPNIIIAHSYGCRVACALYALLKANGEEWKIQGIFMVAGPVQNGNYTALQALNGGATTFDRLAIASGVGFGMRAFLFPWAFSVAYLMSGPVSPRDRLKRTMATWSSFACLLPEDAATLALWQAYSLNPYVTQDWLDRGQASQRDLLANLPPPDKLYNVYASGSATAVGFQRAIGMAPIMDTSGDSLVAVREQIPAGDCRLLSEDHTSIIQSQQLFRLIRSTVAAGWFSPLATPVAQGDFSSFATVPQVPLTTGGSVLFVTKIDP